MALSEQHQQAMWRLRKWSDPRASGNPLQRLRAIWPNPIQMARDIHILLEALVANVRKDETV